jgi:hypothetical protein
MAHSTARSASIACGGTEPSVGRDSSRSFMTDSSYGETYSRARSCMSSQTGRLNAGFRRQAAGW